MDAVEEVRRALAAGADPERAVQQQRYMKSAMPYLGLPMSDVRRTSAAVFREYPLADADAWRASIRRLWHEATHREHRYAAISLLRYGQYRAWAHEPSPEQIGLLRELIVDGAWWDFVDELASHAVGGLLAAHPDEVTPIMRDWSREPDLWLRRTSILCQLGRKAETDTGLLEYAIAGSVTDPDFFARKAIGWALREYSKTDADWVRAYVSAHPDLSGLSQREALKWLRGKESAG